VPATRKIALDKLPVNIKTQEEEKNMNKLNLTQKKKRCANSNFTNQVLFLMWLD
jgi:hypothetical protein